MHRIESWIRTKRTWIRNTLAGLMTVPMSILGGRIFKSAVGIKPTASYEAEGKSASVAQNQFYYDAITMLDEVTYLPNFFFLGKLVVFIQTLFFVFLYRHCTYGTYCTGSVPLTSAARYRYHVVPYGVDDFLFF